MTQYKNAEEVLQAASLLACERTFYIERKGWKLSYVPNVITTYYEKEINSKRWTLTVDDAFTYELKEEEPGGYEY